MRISLRHAVGSSLLAATRALVGLTVCGLLLGLALFTIAQAEPNSPIAFLQAETPEGETAAAEPLAPTPEELRAAKQARVDDFTARLAAGRDETFDDDLVAHMLASQQEIAAETAAIGQTMTAANYEDRLSLEQAVFDTAFAVQYFESANGRLPIRHIISINFPAHETVVPNSSLMPAEHWNIAPAGSGAAKFKLVDDRGEPTSAQLNYASQGGAEPTPLKGGMRSDQAIMTGGIRAWFASHRDLHGPPVTVRITDLSLAMQRGYQVYVYLGVGLGSEPGGPCPLRISIGEDTPLMGGGVLHRFDGEWVRIDPHNGTGNYLVTPLLNQDKLEIEMAPTGFYPGIEMGTAAINAIQLVGARPRTVEAEQEELTRAAASARSAQGKLQQAAQQTAATPPPAEIAPNASARLARLARWQVRVADQIEGFRRGDYGAVVTAMQQELAEVPISP